MRTVLGLTAAALALGSFAMPAQAGCVDDFLGSGGYYVMPDQGSVHRNPDGSYTVQPAAVGRDAKALAGFATGITLNEAGRVLTLVDCVK
jgi:hypothetical protein